MIVLPSATYILQLILSAGTADATVSYVDRTTSVYALGVTQETAATAATQTICAAPGVLTERAIDFVSIYYKTTGGVVTVQTLNSSGSVTTIVFKATLLVGETLVYTHAGGVVVSDANGNRKEVTASVFGSITNTGLTSGRVVYSTTGGLETDSANLTFDGTKLTAAQIGAFTLAGTISGGGNNLNNIIIGAITPLAGSFTTLATSGTLTVGTPGTGASNKAQIDGAATGSPFFAFNQNGLERAYLAYTNGGTLSLALDSNAGTLALGTGATVVQFPGYTAATFAAGDKYLVIDASGNIHRSALGPAS